jgi:N-acetylmuramoyl-L-alanine amidase
MDVNNHRLLKDDGNAVTFDSSPHQGGNVNPIYLIMHYTAGVSASSAISWFNNPIAKASAHLVIDRDGTITQMVPFNRIAWHAGKSEWGHLKGMNKYSIGIELACAGKLRKRENGTWVSWSGAVIPTSEVTVAKHKDEDGTAGWHEYTEAQIEAAIKAGLALHREYDFDDVLGHDDVSPGRKVDPGPLFPMISFRSKVLGRQDN